VTLVTAPARHHCYYADVNQGNDMACLDLEKDKDRELGTDELEEVSGGKGGLVMYNYDGMPVARYHLESAWPSK